MVENQITIQLKKHYLKDSRGQLIRIDKNKHLKFKLLNSIKFRFACI